MSCLPVFFFFFFWARLLARCLVLHRRIAREPVLALRSLCYCYLYTSCRECVACNFPGGSMRLMRHSCARYSLPSVFIYDKSARRKFGFVWCRHMTLRLPYCRSSVVDNGFSYLCKRFSRKKTVCEFIIPTAVNARTAPGLFFF